MKTPGRIHHTAAPQNVLHQCLQAPALFLGVLLTVTLIVAFLNTNWRLATEDPQESTPQVLADALFNSFVLPFEIASVLLLAAVLGAIVLVRGHEE